MQPSLTALGLSLPNTVAGETIVRTKSQLRHPLQVLVQSEQEIQNIQAATTAKLNEVLAVQSARDETHIQKHERQLQVRQEMQRGCFLLFVDCASCWLACLLSF